MPIFLTYNREFIFNNNFAVGDKVAVYARYELRRKCDMSLLVRSSL